VTPEKKLASISTFAALPGVPAGGVCANAPPVNASVQTSIAQQSTGRAGTFLRTLETNVLSIMTILSFDVVVVETLLID
jgi:hypothetical protein